MWTWEHPNWPHFHVDYAVLAPKIIETQQHLAALNQSVAWLTQDAHDQIEIDVLCLESVGTAAIEGITVDPEAVRSSIAKKLGVTSAGWATPPRDVEGLVSLLMAATQHWNKPLDHDTLHAWHGALFPTGRSGMDKIVTAQYRDDAISIISGGPMGKPAIIHYTAPPHGVVQQEMDVFLAWFNNTAKQPSLVRAAVAHFWFEAIHPFEDGNGRIGRAILDLALAQHDKSSQRFFSISHQLSNSRARYVDVMGAINRVQPTSQLSITDWVGLFLDQTLKAILTSQKTVEIAILKNKFWAEHATLPLSDRQRKVINKIMEAGPDGFVGGINNSKYSSLGQTSRATASRDLAELSEMGVLVVKGGGRSTSYVFDWATVLAPSVKRTGPKP